MAMTQQLLQPTLYLLQPAILGIQLHQQPHHHLL